MDFEDLYTLVSQTAGDTTTTGVARAKDFVIMAVRELSYGLDYTFKPWWRKREDTITAVAGTQSYALPTNQGTFESLHNVWYEVNGTPHEIDLVDGQVWQEERNDSSTQDLGTPDICNLHQSSGTVELRFQPKPSAGFVSQADSSEIHLDGFIEEPLATDSATTAEPLMPESRRFGIVWTAVQHLAARQGDTSLIQYASAQAKRYLNIIAADDFMRTNKGGVIRPATPVGDFKGARSRPHDYGFRTR